MTGQHDTETPYTSKRGEYLKVEVLFKGGGTPVCSSRESPVCVISTKVQFIMELESDTYDVVVIGTGLAESIAAA